MMKLLGNPGEEIIYSVPSWFCYAPMAHLHGLKPVVVPMTRSFGLDLDALVGAINERTRILVVNSPHNPSGSIAPPPSLRNSGRGWRPSTNVANDRFGCYRTKPTER